MQLVNCIASFKEGPGHRNVSCPHKKPTGSPSVHSLSSLIRVPLKSNSFSSFFGFSLVVINGENEKKTIFKKNQV